MMASFLITWSNHTWTLLHVSILAAMLLALNVDSEDSLSEEVTEVTVLPNAVYNALVGERLEVNCTVKICENLSAVSWYKFDTSYVLINVSKSSHIKTEWKSLGHCKWISFLLFKNLFMNDTGEYQCRYGLSRSQTINISVHGDDEPVELPWMNDTDSKIWNPDPSEDIWLYVYPASGIVAFVVIVIIISVALMQGCKGKSNKLAPADTQYVAIPMLEQPFPHASLQALPRRSLSVPPSRRSSQRKTPPTCHDELALPRDNEYLYEAIKEDRGRQRNMVEEERSSVVYAMLNHQPLAGAAARPWRLKEENSEYAAIRVKDN